MEENLPEKLDNRKEFIEQPIKKGNKKLAWVLLITSCLILLGIGGVIAYVVLVLNVNVDIEEAFVVNHALLSGGFSNCQEVETLNGWNESTTIEMGVLYPGEEDTLCIKISSLSSADLNYDYIISGTGLEEMIITKNNAPGTVNGLNYTIGNVNVQINNSAAPGEYIPSIGIERY